MNNRRLAIDREKIDIEKYQEVKFMTRERRNNFGAAKTLVVAAIAIILCLLLMVTGTYALFSDDATVSNHLQAGTLEVSMTRTKLVKNALDEKGYLSETTDEEPLTILPTTDDASVNLFGMDENDVIVPGCFYEATVEITNGGSVAFNYYIEIVGSEDFDEAWANQLAISLCLLDEEGNEIEGKEAVGYVGAEDITIGGSDNPVGVMEANATAQSFKIRLEFVDSNMNNDVQGKALTFDFVVHAVQLTEAP